MSKEASLKLTFVGTDSEIEIHTEATFNGDPRDYDNLCMTDKLVVLFLAEIAPLLRKFNSENTEH